MKPLKILFIFLAAGTLVCCNKNDDLHVDDIPGLGGDTWENGTVDNWIDANLTQPYNIAVKYKWDQFELELNKTLVPPLENKVIPVMETIKQGLISPYTAEAGESFFKKYTPKLFVLVGSLNFNTDGTVTEGTAEGGRKVVLYNINNFRIKGMTGYNPGIDSNNVKRMFHVINHEFGHILHQNIMYPEEYKRITIGLYSAGNWFNVSNAEARRNGFITNYAMSGPDEDFVEMIAVMLTEGKAGFDNIVNGITGVSMNGIPPEVAKSRLRQKESMVINYYKDAWSIDFYSLQARSRAAIVAMIY